MTDEKIRRTPARLDLLRTLYPAGKSAQEIAAALNALPGLPVDRATVYNMAHEIGLSRSQGAMGERPAAPKPDPAPEVRQFYGDEAPTLAGFEFIAAWAADRRISFKDWGDLRAVNDKRAALCMPRFARKFGR